MLKLTYISRLCDMVPLAASMEEDKGEFEQYKNQRRKILQQLMSQSNPPRQLSIESGPYTFQ